MGNLIVVAIIAVILFFAIRPIVRFNKEKKNSQQYGCFKCSSASKSNCKGCK